MSVTAFMFSASSYPSRSRHDISTTSLPNVAFGPLNLTRQECFMDNSSSKSHALTMMPMTPGLGGPLL